MTNVFEEGFYPEPVSAAIISLQITLMSNSNEAIAGSTAAKVIQIAKSVADKEVDHELASLRSVVNHELRQLSKGQPRVYESLKDLSKLL